ncbi:Hypothetical predicted protein [Cloeon dipterum]|uniref:Uncharacterized protein n=1 Tax=Cloeon dipterum TaxID=197152 RepID=A0A8S1D3F8_9INSE|nr:Hypothetical predicted protein [Cloeon dipterum]
MSRKVAKIQRYLQPNQGPKAVKLEDFAAFHNLPEDLKKKQIESFRFANSVFPFYIPAEHHEINLSELQNSKGEYWGNAAHFLLCNKAHGIPLWKTFEAQIQSSETTFTCRPHISTNMTNRILQHISINDDDDLNFLFRNWVLVQLPFQPILLFKWLTYALCCLSRIEANVGQLYYVPFPEKFKPELLCLHKMLKTAHRNIGYLFDYLQHQTRCEPDIFVGNLKVFEEILQKIFVFLRFCIVTDGKTFISNLLKVREESLKSNEKVFQLKRGRMALKKRNFLFNLDFWRGPGPHLKIFGDSNEEIVRKRAYTEVNLQDHNFKTNIILERYFEPDDIKKVKMKSMLRDDDFLTIQRKINRLSVISRSIRIEDTESGIISRVLEMNNVVEYGYAVSKFYAWMFKKYKVLPKIHPNSTENPPDSFAVKNIIPLFETINRGTVMSFQKALNCIKRENQSNQKCSSRFEVLCDIFHTNIC